MTNLHSEVTDRTFKVLRDNPQFAPEYQQQVLDSVMMFHGFRCMIANYLTRAVIAPEMAWAYRTFERVCSETTPFGLPMETLIERSDKAVVKAFCGHICEAMNKEPDYTAKMGQAGFKVHCDAGFIYVPYKALLLGVKQGRKEGVVAGKLWRAHNAPDS